MVLFAQGVGQSYLNRKDQNQAKRREMMRAFNEFKQANPYATAQEFQNAVNSLAGNSNMLRSAMPSGPMLQQMGMENQHKKKRDQEAASRKAVAEELAIQNQTIQAVGNYLDQMGGDSSLTDAFNHFGGRIDMGTLETAFAHKQKQTAEAKAEKVRERNKSIMDQVDRDTDAAIRDKLISAAEIPAYRNNRLTELGYVFNGQFSQPTPRPAPSGGNTLNLAAPGVSGKPAQGGGAGPAGRVGSSAAPLTVEVEPITPESTWVTKAKAVAEQERRDALAALPSLVADDTLVGLLANGQEQEFQTQIAARLRSSGYRDDAINSLAVEALQMGQQELTKKVNSHTSTIFKDLDTDLARGAFNDEELQTVVNGTEAEALTVLKGFYGNLDPSMNSAITNDVLQRLLPEARDAARKLIASRKPEGESTSQIGDLANTLVESGAAENLIRNPDAALASAKTQARMSLPDGTSDEEVDRIAKAALEQAFSLASSEYSQQFDTTLTPDEYLAGVTAAQTEIKGVIRDDDGKITGFAVDSKGSFTSQGELVQTGFQNLPLSGGVGQMVAEALDLMDITDGVALANASQGLYAALTENPEAAMRGKTQELRPATDFTDPREIARMASALSGVPLLEGRLQPTAGRDDYYDAYGDNAVARSANSMNEFLADERVHVEANNQAINEQISQIFALPTPERPRRAAQVMAAIDRMIEDLQEQARFVNSDGFDPRLYMSFQGQRTYNKAAHIAELEAQAKMLLGRRKEVEAAPNAASPDVGLPYNSATSDIKPTGTGGVQLPEVPSMIGDQMINGDTDNRAARHGFGVTNLMDLNTILQSARTPTPGGTEINKDTIDKIGNTLRNQISALRTVHSNTNDPDRYLREEIPTLMAALGSPAHAYPGRFPGMMEAMDTGWHGRHDEYMELASTLQQDEVILATARGIELFRAAKKAARENGEQMLAEELGIPLSKMAGYQDNHKGLMHRDLAATYAAEQFSNMLGNHPDKKKLAEEFRILIEKTASFTGPGEWFSSAIDGQNLAQNKLGSLTTLGQAHANTQYVDSLRGN